MDHLLKPPIALKVSFIFRLVDCVLGLMLIVASHIRQTSTYNLESSNLSCCSPESTFLSHAST